MSDKTKIVMIGVLLFTNVLGLVFYVVFSLRAGQGTGLYFAAPIALMVVYFAYKLIIKNYRDVLEGMPLEDERSKNIKTRAAALAFYWSLYWLLALMYVAEFTRLETHTLIGGGIAGMALLYAICYWYVDRKGDTS